ncbi:MAG: hypothetical protein CL764_00780 [Chloroflexi bacterium]|nr:hypothetical protein [Chloroflexota bacterium]|tara:strand:+ start:306 stop:1046 length:741 start_codon:yes stop_codon:yes gene_type:complete
MGYFEFNKQRVFYEVIGEGKPLVLQHGYMQWGEDWHSAGWIKNLQKNHKLIIIDSMGHGRTSNSKKIEDYTIESGVELIIRLMDLLKIKKFNFFGFSMGGRVGFQILSNYSERVDKIIIGGMHPNAPKKYRKQINFKEDANIIIEKTKLVKRPRPSYNINSLKLCDTAQIKWKGLQSELNHISNQMLLFAGDLDPYFDWIKEASGKIKNAQFFDLKGVGHIGSFYRINRSINFIKIFLEKRGDYGK